MKFDSLFELFRGEKIIFLHRAFLESRCNAFREQRTSATMGINNRENTAINQIQYNTIALLPGSNATRYSMAYMTRIWHTLNFRVLIWVQLFGYLTCRSVQQHIIAAHLLDFITNANHEEQY